MAIHQLQPHYTTKARFRAELRDGLVSAIKLATIDVAQIVNDPESDQPTLELGEGIANIPVVTRAALDEAIHGLFSVPLPPPSEREAEVRTNAILNVWARCPNCGIHLVIPLEVLPQLVLDSGGTGELKLKAKSKGRIHACNQLTLDEPEGQLRAFAADSQGSDVEETSEDAEPATPDVVRDLLALVEEADPDSFGVDSWDQVALELVADYARAVHLAASDNDVEIPDRPAVLDAPRCVESNHVPGCGHFGDPGAAEGADEPEREATEEEQPAPELFVACGKDTEQGPCALAVGHEGDCDYLADLPF